MKDLVKALEGNKNYLIGLILIVNGLIGMKDVTLMFLSVFPEPQLSIEAGIAWMVGRNALKKMEVPKVPKPTVSSKPSNG